MYIYIVCNLFGIEVEYTHILFDLHYEYQKYINSFFWSITTSLKYNTSYPHDHSNGLNWWVVEDLPWRWSCDKDCGVVDVVHDQVL